MGKEKRSVRDYEQITVLCGVKIFQTYTKLKKDRFPIDLIKNICYNGSRVGTLIKIAVNTANTTTYHGGAGTVWRLE